MWTIWTQYLRKIGTEGVRVCDSGGRPVHEYNIWSKIEVTEHDPV